MKFDICGFIENLLRKLKFVENMTRITNSIREDPSKVKVKCPPAQALALYRPYGL
jgi:hypothetical protein